MVWNLQIFYLKKLIKKLPFVKYTCLSYFWLMTLYIVYRDFQWLVFCDFSLAFRIKRQNSVCIHCTWLLTCFNLIYQFSVIFKILEQWGIRCECEIYLLSCLHWSEKYQLIFEEVIKPCLHILCRYFHFKRAFALR